eukprot:Seg626.2 transcript_id=Seg626.2/GoldUCD/mRNA.D3Y31 product="Eukaryotic translation initiation factor 2A" protein_id=Seg626.2/GoldUCD/D3Y31
MAAQSQSLPLLAVRGTIGLHMVDVAQQSPQEILSDQAQNCKCFSFSKDGCLFAWCNTQTLQVHDIKTGRTILELPKQKTSQISFSAMGNFLSTWEGYYTSAEKPKGFNNLEIYRIGDGSVVKAFIQKRQETWQPQWTEDELLCARCVNNEVHFYENRDFTSVSTKLYQQGVTNFTLAPGHAPFKVSIFVKGTKAAPSFVRLFQFPNLESQQALANKSFFKADKVDMFWNKKGSSLLILTSTEVDTTGGSYYGEQALHFMSIKGDSSLVPFDKRGPVYAVDWSSNSTEFCVEIWNVKDKKLISKPQAEDSTEFQWAPDGIHFLTATTSPRLKIGNGYKVWHYTGRELHQISYSTGHELYQIRWQPAAEGTYKEAAIVSVSKPITTPAKQEAYRPPSARAAGIQGTKLHEEEPAQNMKSHELSGAALKNRKKREAKAKSGENTQQQISQVGSGAPMTENEKKVKNLKKKLRQIEDLKQKQKEGKTLEKNQLDKIQCEKDLVLEIRELELDS